MVLSRDCNPAEEESFPTPLESRTPTLRTLGTRSDGSKVLNPGSSPAPQSIRTRLGPGPPGHHLCIFSPSISSSGEKSLIGTRKARSSRNGSPANGPTSWIRSQLPMRRTSRGMPFKGERSETSELVRFGYSRGIPLRGVRSFTFRCHCKFNCLNLFL